MQIKPQIVDSKKDDFPVVVASLQLKSQSHIDQQIKFISEKLQFLNSQYQIQEFELNKNINFLIGGGDLEQKYLKSFFKRKFCEQIKLLNDFYQNSYSKSFINCLLFCCKLNWEKKFRIYKYTDQSFEEAIQDLPKNRRDMFYFVNLLYIRLYILYQENCVKIKNFKHVDSSNLIKIIVQNIQNKPNTQKHQPLEQLQKRKLLIQGIIERDLKDMQENKRSFSIQNQEIKMLIEDEQQIAQIVKFQQTKLKTQHLFQQMSTKSLDLRNFFIRKSRMDKNKFVFIPMYDSLISFKFKFQFTYLQKLTQLQRKFQMFYLNSMRIGIKEKVIRMTSKNQTISQDIQCKFIHMLTQRQKSVFHSQQFQSIQDEKEERVEKFWFQSFGQKLIKAIIEVSNKKIQQKKKNKSSLLSRRKKSIKEIDKFKNPQDIYDSSRQFLSKHNI